MGPIITVENISKRFVLSHQKENKYVSLRDVVSERAKRVFSFRKTTSERTTLKEDFWALKDLNFEINRGDRVGIIGRNGAGKSTLLKVLSRITEPTSGRIVIGGRVASLLEVGTGFHPELTGRENIFLNGAILGMNRAEIRKKFDEIVSFAEVAQFLDTPVKRYSSGMYVRLVFSVVVHLEPEILIVDEVLAVGDAAFQKKCLGKMEEVSKGEGRTVLFVSHNMGVISQLCNKTILLNKGQLIFDGKTSIALQKYGALERNSVEVYENAFAKDFSISKVSILNALGLPVYKFSEDIVVNIEINIPYNLSGLHVGVSVIDKWKRKLFTSVQGIQKRSETGLESLRLSIPSNLLLSGGYTVDVATFIPNGTSFSYLKDICPFEIEDYLSEMSIFGDADVGAIHVNCKWD